STNTSYTVIGTNTTTNCSTKNIKAINVYNLPTVIANTTASTICKGAGITLSGAGASSYSWSHGVNNNELFKPQSTATYTVTGTDLHNCSATAIVSIYISTSYVTNIFKNICQGQSYSFHGHTYSSMGTYNDTLHSVI